jgi:acyl carrier protein
MMTMMEQSAADLGAAAIEREIARWMKSYLADLLEIAISELDEETSFDRYGLDSLASVGMVGDLEEWLGSELDPALTSDYPSIKALARELASDARLRAILTRRLGSPRAASLP